MHDHHGPTVLLTMGVLQVVQKADLVFFFFFFYHGVRILRRAGEVGKQGFPGLHIKFPQEPKSEQNSCFPISFPLQKPP